MNEANTWAWLELNSKKTPQQSIAEGAAVFAIRFNRPPTIVHVNPVDAGVLVDGIEVQVKEYVPSKHYRFK